VQLTAVRAAQLREENRINKDYLGYESEDPNTGDRLAEYHVDDIEAVHTLPELEGVSYGGNLSVRIKGEPMMLWGHDEACAHEKAFNANVWLGHSGQQPLRPKDLGAALHISAFVNDCVGWAPRPSLEELAEINRRRYNTDFVAQEAAGRHYGTTKKPDLKDENLQAFTWIMRPGANRDGYWNLDQFVIQFENLADVCAVMYPNMKHLVSLDNSANHRGKRPGGLDIVKMNKGYGGAQCEMEETTIPENVRELGVETFENGGRRLPPGSAQATSFQPGDEGPYYLKPEDRVYRQTIQYTGKMVSRKLRKNELITRLREFNSNLDRLDQRSFKALQDLAASLRIPASEHIPEVVKGSGWEGQPKGMAQMLMERGLIDASRPIADYSKAYMKSLLSSCSDFENELCLMEYVAEKYGWRVVFSAKGYCDVAGLGIEYNWAVAKNKIHRTPLSDRKGFENFDKVFRCAMSSETLNLRVVRGCARKCRNFMRAYLFLHSKKGDISAEKATIIDSLEVCVDQVSYSNLQKICKQIKTHRNVADFCGSDIREIEANSQE
jgi:hypothetical protein